MIAANRKDIKVWCKGGASEIFWNEKISNNADVLPTRFVLLINHKNYIVIYKARYVIEIHRDSMKRSWLTHLEIYRCLQFASCYLLLSHISLIFEFKIFVKYTYSPMTLLRRAVLIKIAVPDFDLIPKKSSSTTQTTSWIKTIKGSLVQDVGYTPQRRAWCQ